MYQVTDFSFFGLSAYVTLRPNTTDLYGVTDSFVQDTCYIFSEIWKGIRKYNAYPRMVLSLNLEISRTMEMEIRKCIIDDLSVPCFGTDYDNENLLLESFYYEPEEKIKITNNWKKWTTEKLKIYYHDRTSTSLHKDCLHHVLRPGELTMCKMKNTGIVPGTYEIIKKCRHTSQIDFMDQKAFSMPPQKLFAYCSNLDAKPHRLMDACLLYLIDQCMYQRFQVRFAALYTRSEYKWDEDSPDIQSSEYPLILQSIGGWDVYFDTNMYHARSMQRAFLIWCFIIYRHKNCELQGAANIRSLVEEILFGTQDTIITEITQNHQQKTTKKQKSVRLKYWF
jgi:hypothetical protein